MKIAVIGAGISGLASAWLLAKEHEVHLFESENRLGGHAHTVHISEDENQVPIDTGFLVYNEVTYPNLVEFFKALDVETVDSEMSLSIQVQNKKLEWSGTNLNTVFAQRSNILKFRFHRMLLEILRFGREAEENLISARRHAWTLGELLLKKRYAPEFATDYLLPIGSAIWSSPEKKMTDFPASTFLNFFINHKMLQVNNRPKWRTVKNGSIHYVNKAAASIQKVHVGMPVREVERLSRLSGFSGASPSIVVRTDKVSDTFDRVVIATHTPITAKILKSQSALEHEVLSSILYESNRTLLHRDSSFMPKRKACWSAWNVFGSNNLEHSQKVSLSYYLNLLQPLPTTQNYFVTLNPSRSLKNVLQEFDYSHPQFDQKAIRAQAKLEAIQGTGGVYYAGAWSRYGFHEDGLLSAINVARQMGVEIPWVTK